MAKAGFSSRPGNLFPSESVRVTLPSTRNGPFGRTRMDPSDIRLPFSLCELQVGVFNTRPRPSEYFLAGSQKGPKEPRRVNSVNLSRQLEKRGSQDTLERAALELPRGTEGHSLLLVGGGFFVGRSFWVVRGFLFGGQRCGGSIFRRHFDL